MNRAFWSKYWHLLFHIGSIQVLALALKVLVYQVRNKLVVKDAIVLGVRLWQWRGGSKARRTGGIIPGRGASIAVVVILSLALAVSLM